MDKFEGAEFTLDLELEGQEITVSVEVTIKWADGEWEIVECPVEPNTDLYKEIVQFIANLPHPSTMEWDTYRSHGE